MQKVFVLSKFRKSQNGEGTINREEPCGAILAKSEDEVIRKLGASRGDVLLWKHEGGMELLAPRFPRTKLRGKIHLDVTLVPVI